MPHIWDLLAPTETYWFFCPQTVTSKVRNLPLGMSLLQIVSRDVDIPGSPSLNFWRCLLSPWGIDECISQDGHFYLYLP